MALLNRLYPPTAVPGMDVPMGFDAQAILEKALARNNGAVEAIFFFDGRAEKLQGKVVDAANGVALLNLGEFHQVVDLKSVVALSIRERLGA